jgi:hypothetical protein
MTTPHWVMIGGAVGVGVLVRGVVGVFAHYRGEARGQFVEWVRRERPGVEVVSVGGRGIVVRRGGIEGRVEPREIYTRMDVNNAGANGALFEELLEGALAREVVR